MGKTAAQYAYLNEDMLLRGVFETIVSEDPLFEFLNIKAVTGKSVMYDMEVTLPGIGKISGPHEDIPESTGTVEQRTLYIKRYIGDADTDKFEMATNWIQDPRVQTIADKSKAMSREVHQDLITGQTATNSTTSAFKGLLRILAEMESSSTTDLDAGNNDMVMVANATSTTLTLDLLDELVDMVKPGRADMLLLNRPMKRKVKSLARAAGTGLQYMPDLSNFGHRIDTYDLIPLMVSDYIANNYPDGSGSVLTIANYNPSTTRADTVDNSIILAMKNGDGNCTLMENGSMTHEDIGTLEKQDAYRDRFKWYLGAACFNKYSLAGMINVQSAAA